MTDHILTLLVRIEGRVQGVWYRGWTLEQAAALGLTGWVRNRYDGSVEALFHGPAEAVRTMLSACRQGPPSALVANIISEPANPPDRPGFHKLATTC